MKTEDCTIGLEVLGPVRAGYYKKGKVVELSLVTPLDPPRARVFWHSNRVRTWMKIESLQIAPKTNENPNPQT